MRDNKDIDAALKMLRHGYTPSNYGGWAGVAESAVRELYNTRAELHNLRKAIGVLADDQ
jgi:hypothetical protein